MTRTAVQGGQPANMSCSTKGQMLDEVYSANFTFYYAC